MNLHARVLQKHPLCSTWARPPTPTSARTVCTSPARTQSLGLPSFQTPKFRVEAVTPTSLELHYASHRPGLGALVEGCIHAVARLVYGVEIDMSLIRGRADGSCEHEVGWRDMRSVVGWRCTFSGAAGRRRAPPSATSGTP